MTTDTVAPAADDLVFSASAEADTPFEGGQQIALAVMREAVETLGPDDARAMMLGLFSGAMSTLQQMMGTPQVRDLFETFASAERTGPQRGMH